MTGAGIELAPQTQKYADYTTAPPLLKMLIYIREILGESNSLFFEFF